MAQTNIQTDMGTLGRNRPSGVDSVKMYGKVSIKYYKVLKSLGILLENIGIVPGKNRQSTDKLL